MFKNQVWQISNLWFQISEIEFQSSNLWLQVSGFESLIRISNLEYPMTNFRKQISDIQIFAFKIRIFVLNCSSHISCFLRSLFSNFRSQISAVRSWDVLRVRSMCAVFKKLICDLRFKKLRFDIWYMVWPKVHAHYRSTISAKLNFQLLKTQISFSELRLL